MMFCGEQGNQSQSASDAGSSASLGSISKRRIWGKFAAATSSFQSLHGVWPIAGPSGFSMFDCPEATQTSPTRISSSWIVFLPRIVMRRPLRSAFMAGNTTLQLPCSSAFPFAVAPPNSTVISSSGSAQPQIGIGLSRCKTM